MSFDEPEQELSQFRRRVLVAGAFVMLCFVVLAARFAWLQVSRFDYYHTRAEDNRIALVPIVSGMKGQVLGFDGHPTAAGWDVFQTLLPMTAEDDLFNALGSATRGTAWFTTQFDHYQEARKEELADLI